MCSGHLLNIPKLFYFQPYSFISEAVIIIYFKKKYKVNTFGTFCNNK